MYKKDIVNYKDYLKVHKQPSILKQTLEEQYLQNNYAFFKHKKTKTMLIS